MPPEAVGCAAVPGTAPGAAAAHDAVPAVRRAGRINDAGALVAGPPIKAPLPDVTMHVEEAPGIGSLLGDRMGLAARFDLGRVPGCRADPQLHAALLRQVEQARHLGTMDRARNGATLLTLLTLDEPGLSRLAEVGGLNLEDSECR